MIIDVDRLVFILQIRIPFRPISNAGSVSGQCLLSERLFDKGGGGVTPVITSTYMHSFFGRMWRIFFVKS